MKTLFFRAFLLCGVFTIRASRADEPHFGQGRRDAVTCQSEHDRYSYCPFDGELKGIYLERQLSSSSCVEGESWGYDNHGVWVNHGCRAVFSVDLY